MKNKMRMIKAAIGVRCVSCFVGPPATFLASPATLNLFDNPELPLVDVNAPVSKAFLEVSCEKRFPW